MPTPPPHTPLSELAALFLKLGGTAFGGPAVHIAMMEDEVVRRRGWLTQAEFLDYLGATHLIPGPNSTEMAIHIGHARAGWRGLIVAGVCFMVPAVVIVTVLAWAYVRFGTRPAAAGLLYGVKPVVIAIVVQALWRLAPAALRRPHLAAVAALALAASLAGVHELLILPAAAVIAAIGARAPVPGSKRGLAPPSWLLGPAAVVPAAMAAPVGLWPLLAVFLKTGAVLFGSGYVLLAFLRADLVQRLGWLTESQLLDAVAVGQITPGPVFTTATFIGYVLAGGGGAAVATIGIFLPAFVFVALSGPLVPLLRRSATAGAALDGVIAASLALMATVTWHLGRAAIVDVLTMGLALASALLLLRFQMGSSWLVAGGAIAGLLARLLG